MYYRADGKAVDVVNDFDLATLAGSECKFGNERTGTIPFMAIELLDEDGQNGCVAHKYRHEVESLIWVSTWISCQYSDVDGTLRKGFLDQLSNVSAITCAEKKSLFLMLTRHAPPNDVDERLQDRVKRFLKFLRGKVNVFYDINRKLELARLQLRRQDEEQAASKLEETVAGLEVKLDGEDDMPRDFAKVIGFDDIEGKVERAAKGIPTGPQVDSLE